MGKLLRVDLTEGKLLEEDLDPQTAEHYIGGRGYAAKILFEELKKGVDPLSPENKLIIATGPLTGTQAPTSGRFSVSSKSPLTGALADSNCGGHFGPALKRAGYDFIIIEGKSEKPVYLYIENRKAELKSADSIFGSTTDKCEDLLKKEHGDDTEVISIGPAGENLVSFASIIADKHRAAGRCGLGAVMGSKKLKAIAVKGNMQIELANPYAFNKIARQVTDVLMRNPITGYSLGRYGTASLVTLVNKAGVFPVNNFKYSFSENVESISGEALAKKLLIGKKACYACPIKCGRIIRLKDGTISEGPEYETIWSLGANCGIFDLEKIALGNDLCDKYGLDTVSMGNVLGFLTECCERGLANNLELEWGKQDLPSLIRQTAYREGVGALLAKGVARLSKELKAEEFAIHSKGLELPGYDPRGLQGYALALATSNRGGCHLRAYTISTELLNSPRYTDPLEVRGKAMLVKKLQDIYAVIDSLILCKFTSFALFNTLDFEPTFYAKMLTTATGFYFDEQAIREVGERIYNLERLFNYREGFTRSDDTLPLRILRVPVAEGPAEGHTARLGEMLDEYYTIRGWTYEGKPSDTLLIKLGIIKEPEWPKLQVALDFRELDEALKVAEAVYKSGVDWLEVGTPLIKSAGVMAIRELRNRFPNSIIVADLKTMDTGWLEVEIAAQAGADVVCICGLANDNTIKDAVGCARKYGVKIMADLLEVKDLKKRAIELKKLGVDYICVHTGIDVQRDREQEIDRKVFSISEIIREVKIPVAAAGGIRLDTVNKVVRSGVSIVIVGSAITKASDPAQAASAFLRAIRRG